MPSLAACRRSALLLYPLFLTVVVLFCSCSAGEARRSAIDATALRGLLDPPSSYRAASDDEELVLSRAGSEFLALAPVIRVEAAGELGVFSPGEEGGGLDQAAVAVYQLAAPGFDRMPVAGLDIPDYGSHRDSLFIGLANWQTNRWDWQPANEVPDVNFDPPVHLDPLGKMLVAFALLGGAGQMELRNLNFPYCLDWCRSVGASGVDVLETLLVDDDGCVYACGFTRSFSAGRDRMIAKFNARGELIWVKWFEYPDGSQLYDVGTQGDLYALHPEGGVVGVAPRGGIWLEEKYLPVASTLFHVEEDGNLGFQTHFGSSEASKPGSLGAMADGSFVYLDSDVVSSGEGYRDELRVFHFDINGNHIVLGNLVHPDATDDTEWNLNVVCPAPSGSSFTTGVRMVTLDEELHGSIAVDLGPPATAEMTHQHSGHFFDNGDNAASYVGPYNHPELGMVYQPFIARLQPGGTSVWSMRVLLGDIDGGNQPVPGPGGELAYPGRSNVANGSSPFVSVFDESGAVKGIYLWDAPGQARSLGWDEHGCIYAGFCSVIGGELTGITLNNGGTWDDRTDEAEVEEAEFEALGADYLRNISVITALEVPFAQPAGIIAHDGPFEVDSGGGADDMVVSKLDRYSQR